MSKMAIFTILILLTCTLSASNSVIADFGNQDEFFFGLATAPAHVEDKLEDSWIDFAKNGGVAAFTNHPYPEDRLRFWSNPRTDINLAARTGVKVFRMGMDWGRLVPNRPGSLECGGKVCSAGIQDFEALKRYREIVKMVRRRGMKVMMSVFHHSMPKWAVPMRGFINHEVGVLFEAFAKSLMYEMSDLVDSWVIFNEPSVFAFLTYTAGIWPPGVKDYTGFFSPWGTFGKAVKNMTNAHNNIYKAVRQPDFSLYKIGPIGVANNVTYHVGTSMISGVSAHLMKNAINYGFVDKIAKNLDFHGINYYGEEHIKGLGVYMNPEREYSDSGRVISPSALYLVLKDLHKRYNVDFKGRKKPSGNDLKMGIGPKEIPFVITENGIADSTDKFRPSYIIEHLLSIDAARRSGVPIKGYVFWTISDNFEWADGYCPKFGLVHVDRSRNLKRTVRNSYKLFSEIVKRGRITQRQRDEAWLTYVKAIGTNREFCRSDDGQTSFDEPVLIPIKDLDWRFENPDKE